MKKVIKVILIFVLICFGILYIGLLDGYFVKSDTKYSENYSELKFKSIEEGFSEKQVIDILGKPIAVFSLKNGIVLYQYSYSPSDTNYDLRQIYIQNRKVIEVVKYFYYD